MRLHVIGDFASLPEICQKELKEGMEMTASGTGLNLILALSYSARWELQAAVKKIAAEAAAGQLDVAAMDAAQFEQYLCTAPYPDPELMIRTGGGTQDQQFLAVPDGLYRIIFYRYTLAGFQEKPFI